MGGEAYFASWPAMTFFVLESPVSNTLSSAAFAWSLVVMGTNEDSTQCIPRGFGHGLQPARVGIAPMSVADKRHEDTDVGGWHRRRYNTQHGPPSTAVLRGKKNSPEAR